MVSLFIVKLIYRDFKVINIISMSVLIEILRIH
jgi:hypothetical protein